jgi:nucleoside-diphosphate-sugar epimerase
MPVVNARFFNSYGPGEVPGKYRNVIPNFMYWAMNKRELPITGTGNETRDFTYVGDIIEGLLAMAYYPKAIGEAFNLGTGREIKISDLANWINEITGNSAGIDHIERRNWDKKNRLLASIDRAKRVLRYKPAMDFKKGLEGTHGWFKGNWENIQASAEFG